MGSNETSDCADLETCEGRQLQETPEVGMTTSHLWADAGEESGVAGPRKSNVRVEDKGPIPLSSDSTETLTTVVELRKAMR